ncbi:MAG: PAS domain S-box protein [Syntrophobacteraceae bacterium]
MDGAGKSPRKIFAGGSPLFSSIRGKLFLLVQSVLIPVILIQIGYIYLRFKGRVESASRTNLQLSRTVAADFAEFIKDTVNQELSLSASFTMPTRPSADEMLRLLELNRKESRAISSFSWLDPHGRVIASSLSSSVGEDLSDRTYVRALLSGRQWVVSDLIRSRATGKPVFTISRAFRTKSGNLLGMVVAAVEPEKLKEELFFNLVDDEAITVIDSHGNAVWQYPENREGRQKRNFLKDAPSVRLALEGREFTRVFSSFDTKKNRIVSLSPIASIGWAALAESPEEKVMAPIRAQLLQEMAIFFLLMLGVFFGAFVLSEGLSGSIRSLLEHALALGGGTLNGPIEERGPYELKGLAFAFNVMAQKVLAREEALKAEQERLISLCEAIPACVSLQAPDRSITYANQRFRETFGDPEGKYCYELLENRSEVCENCDQFRSADIQDQHWEWVDSAGRYYSVHTHPFTDGNGVPLVLKLALDISERKRAWQALAETETRLRELAENIRDVFWVSSPERLLYVSPAYEEIWGRSRESLYEDPASYIESVHPLDRERVVSAFPKSLEAREPSSLEFRILRPDETMRWVLVRSFPVFEQGRLVRMVGIAEDVTAGKEAEEFLRSERDLAFGLGEAHNLAEGMKHLLTACLALSGVDSGAVYLFENGEPKLLCHKGLSEQFLESAPLKEQARFAGKTQGSGAKTSDTTRMEALLGRQGIAACWTSPVRHQGEVVSVLYLASHINPEIPENSRIAVEVLATRIEGFISRVKLVETIEEHRKELQESNTALKVLLRQREEDRKELQESFLQNVEHLIEPYMEKLKKTHLVDEQKEIVELLESHLQEITSPFARKISEPLLGLTPTEIRVADLIRKGKGSKEIAELLGISEYAVVFHRQGIRRKLGLSGKKLNLQAHLGRLGQL